MLVALQGLPVTLSYGKMTGGVQCVSEFRICEQFEIAFQG